MYTLIQVEKLLVHYSFINKTEYESSTGDWIRFPILVALPSDKELFKICSGDIRVRLLNGSELVYNYKYEGVNSYALRIYFLDRLKSGFVLHESFENFVKSHGIEFDLDKILTP
jgi:hypothetical protein